MTGTTTARRSTTTGRGGPHRGVDSHAWLDAENRKVRLDVIAVTLRDLDLKNAYAAEAGKAEIDAATDETRQMRALISDQQFVVFHDAYQYFENRFALSAAGAIALCDASAPSPARIEEVRNAVRDRAVKCGLAEPQFNQGLVRTVVEGRDMKSSVIVPTGCQIAMDPEFYPQLKHSIAGKLAACGE